MLLRGSVLTASSVAFSSSNIILGEPFADNYFTGVLPFSSLEPLLLNLPSARSEALPGVVKEPRLLTAEPREPVRKDWFIKPNDPMDPCSMELGNFD